MSLAIVTGASRGIGRELASRLIRRGYTVAAVARSEAELATLDGALPVPLDLTDAQAADRGIGALLERHGPCAVLVNNAGLGLRAAVEEIQMDEWRRQFELNLFSCARLTQLVLPGMRAARRGHVQNISSVAPWGIHMTLIEPGPVRTHFVEAAASVSGGVLDDPESPYATPYRAMRAQLEGLHAGAWPVERVADVCLAAIESERPRARYPAYSWTLSAALALKAASPSLFDRMQASRMGLATR